MDDARFDRLTRALATRRTAVAGLLAALLPIAGLARPDGVENGKRRPDRARGDAGGGRKLRDPDARATGAEGPNAERCIANGQRCGKGSGKRGKKDKPCAKCCSKYATPKTQGPRRCSCKPANVACTNNAQCCGGQCTGGRCGPCNPGLTVCQPDGCIDTQTSNDHCGSCPNACGADQVCVTGACTCTAGSCPVGCCAGDQCKPGTTDAACGQNGESCTACPAGSTCCGGVCCPGCCDAGVCKTGDTDGACGTGGTTCATCVGDQDCVSGQCTCTAGSCPDGCCNGDQCKPGTSVDFCGGDGDACIVCVVAGETCTNGACVCPSGVICSGSGCCPGANNVCDLNDQCCLPDADSETCDGKCGAVQNNCGQSVNCSALCDGCCDGGTCRAGTADASCGQNGATCQTCANPNPVCAAQTCTPCSSDGQCGSGETCQSGDCICGVTNLQAAVNAASAGDTIYLCRRAYEGANAVATINKDLTIVGRGDGSTSAANTILDAQGVDRVIGIDPNRTVTIRDVRITGGASNGQSGVSNRGNLTLENCTITENNTTSPNDGGGIGSTGTPAPSLIMTNCTISKNTAGSSGGLTVVTGTATLTNCTVTENEVTGSIGGIYVSDETILSLIDSTVSGNIAVSSPGGIRTRGTVNLTNSSISGNTPGNCQALGSGTFNGTGCAP